jgi:hypothetical protein
MKKEYPLMAKQAIQQWANYSLAQLDIFVLTEPAFL